MEIALTITGFYLVGFFLSLTFFKFFGKKIGFDYDNPSEWYDDWQSNAEAYLAFAAMWFLMMPVLVLVAIVKLLVMFNRWFLKLGVKKHKICKHKIDGLCPYPNVHCAYPDCEKN